MSGLRKPLKTAVFISGSGSTLQALLEMQHQFDIQLVVTNQTSALGLLKVKRFGKTSVVVKNPIDYDQLQQTLLDFKIDRILLAGFMKIIPESFVHLWQGRMINIHPSLLPAYPGLNSAQRSWQDQNDMGVTLHFVTPKVDEGSLFLQKKSLTQVQKYTFKEANLFLRSTEQHLLRELVLRWN